MKHVALIMGLVVQAIAFSSCTTVDDSPSQASSTSPTTPSFKATAEADRKARETGEKITPYPFDTCAVQFNKKFKDGKPKHRRVYKGQEVLFCCTPCLQAFDMNPDPFMPRIIAAAQAKEAGSGQ